MPVPEKNPAGTHDNINNNQTCSTPETLSQFVSMSAVLTGSAKSSASTYKNSNKLGVIAFTDS